VRRAAAGLLALAVLAAAAVAARQAAPGLRSRLRHASSIGLPAVGAKAEPADRQILVGDAGWIAAENRHPGSAAWRITRRGDPAAIEGYADRVSAAPGEAVRLFVSTTAPGFHVEAYRIGWYGGKRGRLLWRSPQLHGRRQAPPDTAPLTNLVEAPWRPSLRLTVGSDWPPGDYLLKLVASTGPERYVPLTVTNDSSPDPLVVMNAVTTWEAYNDWGGRNLYWGPGREPELRSRVASFDRPYLEGDGAGDFLSGELPLVSLVEQAGFDVSYWTDVDLHQRPGLLLRHRALLSLGHDEYWSTVMRRGAEAARDHGVNLAFLGANAVFRHIRLEPSPLGPDRHEVNYKPQSARADPAWRSDRKEVTTDWREPPLDQPESDLLGELYECNPAHADAVITAADPSGGPAATLGSAAGTSGRGTVPPEPPGSSWLLRGTGLHAGSTLPNLIGPEYDRVMTTAPTPARLELIAHSPLRCRFHASFSDVTWYTTRSGAGVLDTGTSSWVCQLDQVCAAGRNSPVTAAAVRQITLNLLRAFADGPAGWTHPATPNLSRFDLRPSGL